MVGSREGCETAAAMHAASPTARIVIEIVGFEKVGGSNCSLPAA